MNTWPYGNSFDDALELVRISIRAHFVEIRPPRRQELMNLVDFMLALDLILYEFTKCFANLRPMLIHY